MELKTYANLHEEAKNICEEFGAIYAANGTINGKVTIDRNHVYDLFFQGNGAIVISGTGKVPKSELTRKLMEINQFK